jgi:hypothetical protein
MRNLPPGEAPYELRVLAASGRGDGHLDPIEGKVKFAG